jgi:hypothetical protein
MTTTIWLDLAIVDQVVEDVAGHTLRAPVDLGPPAFMAHT